MARPGVSYVDVAKAATKLIEQDINPTVEEVRKVLGTGSNSTINRHLRDWRSKQGQQLEAQKGIPSSLLIAVKGLYDAMNEGAEQKITRMEEAAQQKVVEIEQQRKETTSANAALILENKELENKLDEALSQIDKLTTKLDSTEQALSQQITENNSLSQRLLDKKDEIKRIENQTQHAQKNLEHYRESIRQQREEEKLAHDTALMNAEHQLRTQQGLYADCKAENKQLHQNRLDLENKLEAIQVELAKAQKQSQATELELKKQALNYNQLQKDYDTIVKSNGQINEELDASKENMAKINVQLVKEQERINSLQDSILKAEDTIVVLRDKNMFLIQEKTELATMLKKVETVK